MFKITIEATTKKDKELIPLLLDHLCYSITGESGINLDCPEWSGHSGGDDAYFELIDREVRVLVK
jgi:hypothetical protein